MALSPAVFTATWAVGEDSALLLGVSGSDGGGGGVGGAGGGVGGVDSVGSVDESSGTGVGGAWRFVLLTLALLGWQTRDNSSVPAKLARRASKADRVNPLVELDRFSDEKLSIFIVSFTAGFNSSADLGCSVSGSGSVSTLSGTWALIGLLLISTAGTGDGVLGATTTSAVLKFSECLATCGRALTSGTLVGAGLSGKVALTGPADDSRRSNRCKALSSLLESILVFVLLGWAGTSGGMADESSFDEDK